MEFLYLLEKIRVPGLNELMLAVTELGGEMPFLIIALVVFWCVTSVGDTMYYPLVFWVH